MSTLFSQRRALSDAMRAHHSSARTLDARGHLSGALAAHARTLLDTFGYLHLINTGLRDTTDLLPLMTGLGFGPDTHFTQGGRTSAHFQPKWVDTGLRRMDHYPPPLYLLPNNEVQYQRFGPARVLFFCRVPPTDGGRTFLHSARAVEQHLRRAGPLGEDLLRRFDAHGLMIETGFLDAAHPQKADNYFQSWQERFGSADPDQAIDAARALRHEYDRCWWREEGDGLRTLMTRITLSAFKHDHRDGYRYLRFPRMALGEPALANGYRRYPLGDGTELTDAERDLLMAAYLDTREGISLSQGDLILFDNIRYGHSRESFTGPREVDVGMAGVVWDDAVAEPVSSPPPRRVPQRAARTPAPEHYRLPPNDDLWAEERPGRILDARGSLDDDDICAAIRAALAQHGAVHVRNTGLRDLSEPTLDRLGFGARDQFAWGGFTCGRTARRALNRTLRATDDYPADRWLLPHNEILYQRHMPARLLFFTAQSPDPLRGGRTFAHSARLLEQHIRRCGPVGEALLADLEAHGFLIEMGFLDDNHPQRAENYFRSWQDRFDTTDRDEALARCRDATDQFDRCWWREEAPGVHTLMTQIQVPAFQVHPVSGERFLFFPRIALDAPAVRNGHRRFPKGDGTPLTPDEIDILLDGFLATREGVRWRAGDLLLLDNIRYGHSREPFAGPRELGVAMAGRFWTDDAR